MSNDTPLIEWRDDSLSVGLEEMDATHREFIDLLNRLARADDATFPALFREMLEHTRAHFQRENTNMEESGFPPITIHQGEHARILDELDRLTDGLETGDIEAARNYVCQYLPEWFSMHAATMDRALAWHLKASGLRH